LFIETPEANLVAGMSWLQNTATRRYKVRHQAWGRLFGDRYKAVLVDGADTYQYRRVAEIRAHDEQQAERWLSEGLKAAGQKAPDLGSLKGSDPRKLALAELLWKRTTVSQKRIAKKLAMRRAANVSQSLRRIDRKKQAAQLPVKLKRFLDEA